MTTKRSSIRSYPVTREGWHRFYADIYDRTGRKSALTMSTWYLLLLEAFGERDVPKPDPYDELTHLWNLAQWWCDRDQLVYSIGALLNYEAAKDEQSNVLA